MKILVVEDNKINQMIKKMLLSKGITCEIIDNGEEAIDVLKIKYLT
jgi:CheY-like chemotaxis protein